MTNHESGILTKTNAPGNISDECLPRSPNFDCVLIHLETNLELLQRLFSFYSEITVEKIAMAENKTPEATLKLRLS